MVHKLGLIGYGGMASGYHTDTCLRDDVDFELTAVYDLRESQRELARSRGFKTFDSLEDFLNSGLFEMVTVAVSNNNHCPLVCAALEAGYHVMVEKPVALTSDEIVKMWETAKRAGKMFTVHHNRRFDRDFLIVKQALEEGLLGKPHVIESRIHMCPNVGPGCSFSGWRALEDQGGGLFLDWGIHILDQLLYLVKEPVVSVYCNMVCHGTSKYDEYTRLNITFESGLSAVLETAQRSALQHPRWYISGDEGTLSIDRLDMTSARIRRVSKRHFEDGSVTAYTLTEACERPTRDDYYIDEIQEFDYPAPEKCPPQDWASLYKNLAAHLEGREELVVKPEEVLRCFKVVEAAFVSAREHRSVQL